MSDRRRSQRLNADQEIYARIKSSIPVRIVDVSRHGMQVESTSALPPSGECDIWLPADGGDVKMRIRVQRCRARFVKGESGFRGLMYQAGLEFLQVDEPAKSALISILQRLGDTSADEPIATTVSERRDERDEPHSIPHGVPKAG